MKKLLLAVGMGVFWLAWPVWRVYFKRNPERSRVLTVCGDNVLLVRGWLGTGAWGLPGGGAHKDEAAADSAVRELAEEVGLKTVATALRSMGTKRHNRYGLRYRAHYFALELDAISELKVRHSEIADALWMPVSVARSMKLDDDASYALKKYRPIDQPELLPIGS